MRLMPTGRTTSEVVEVWEGVTACACGRSLLEPPYTVGWLMCGCAGGHGHRIRTCVACWVDHYDPEHVDVLAREVGTDYFGG